MIEQLTLLIAKYDDQLVESVDSMNYWSGRRKVYTEANESYIKAEKSSVLYRQIIEDLTLLME